VVVAIDPEDDPQSQEGFVRLHLPPDSTNVTIRNEGLVFTGGLGQRRQ
jgi:hypothetical protein